MSDPTDSQGANPRPLPQGLLSQYPWLTFLLPFVVYMLFTTFEPTPTKAGGLPGLVIHYEQYPVFYTVKIAATLAAIWLVIPGYRTFPPRLTLLAPAIGAIGVVLWIGLWSADLEGKILIPLGLGSIIDMGDRPSFNPLVELGHAPVWAYTFLGVRFLGLVLVVPVVEEFFLRGFVMRIAVAHRWWEVPFGQVTTAAILLGTLVFVLGHPAEIFAALLWFSLVTLLMLRTKSIWDCVVAHATTNLLLGIYVVYSDDWELM